MERIENRLRHPRTAVILAMLVLGWSLCPTSLPASDVVTVNPQTQTYDYHPSVISNEHGELSIAWHAYRDGRDSIRFRHRSAGDFGNAETISQHGTVHSPPTLVGLGDDRTAVVWSRKQGNRWRIRMRMRSGGQWHDAIAVSDRPQDAIFPTAIAIGGGRLLVTWCEAPEDRFQVRCRILGDALPAPSFVVSGDDVDAVRSALVKHDNEVWAIWDQYQKPSYSIHARRVFPTIGPIESVSPPDRSCLKPTAIEHSGRMIVAWLSKQGVTGGPGVISQLHTLHAAIRSGDQWKTIQTKGGSDVAAELTHGLMAKIEPKMVATGGYLGPRTKPMLHADGDDLWLLWERKSDHRGSTPKVTGELCGRKLVDDAWADPMILARDHLDYHVVDSTPSQPGRFQLLASRLPVGGIRHYELFEADAEQAKPLNQESWQGWRPISLPIENERQRITQLREPSRKVYSLYWADLHCHNGLTADAEGEPDELHWYARDRASINITAFTNNDFYNVPLTQYDYQLGVLMARVFSAKHEKALQFLSLPGYEWTSRIPGVRDVPQSDPGNWLPPYQHRSFPNHRSVIYPPPGGPLVHFTEVGNDIAQLNEAVEQAGGITLSQHNAFRLSDHPVEVGLELTSGWSNYIAQRPKLFHEPLMRGRRLAFTASGDTHRRTPGLSGALTGIYAESLDPDAILDALRAGRCFATMGAKIFVDARANGEFMGASVNATNRTVHLTLAARGTRPITHAVLIRDGEEIHRAEGTGDEGLGVSFTDKNLSPGTHWYYWRITQEKTAPVLPGNLMPAHGHLAWSTPNWVMVEQ